MPHTPATLAGKTRAKAALLSVLAAALWVGATVCAAAAAGEPRSIVAAVPANLPPLYTLGSNGRPTGFAAEVLRQVALRAGYSLRFVAVADQVEAMRLVETGQADMVPGLGADSERATRLLFSRPFETQAVHIYTRAESPRREDLASLAGLRVSVVAGSIPLERLARAGSVPHVAQSLPQALFDLFSGQTDALVFQAPLVEHASKAAGLEDRLVRSKAPLLEVNRALAVSPRRPELLADLDRVLGQYRETPEFRLLYRQWHAAAAPPVLTPMAMGIMAAIVVVVGAVLLTWRYVSLLRVNRRLLAALTERDQALAALRLGQDRMEALLTLIHMDSADTRGLVGFALDQGVALTGSGMGFLFFVEGDRIDPEQVHWRLPDGATSPPEGLTPSYTPARGGLWADCLRTKAPVLVNDYPAYAAERPLPQGHPDLARFMAVPLLETEQVVAVLGVANKQTPYDDNDTRQLQLFLAGLWRVLQARRDAESIRKSRDYAESLIEGANAMLVRLDTEGRTTLFNAAAERITGYSRSEVLGREWNAQMLPGHLSNVSAALYGDFMAGRTALPRQHEGVLLTKNGLLRHISWQNSLLREGERVAGIIAFGIDITEQKEAQAELTRLHRAIEQAAEGVVIAAEPGVILYANPAFERMTGREPGGHGLKGKGVFDLDLAVLEHHSCVTPAEGQEGTWRGTCSFARPDGVAMEVEFTVSAIRSRADRLVSYVAVCRDVTEKRLLEHQLWQAQKMEALGTLAGGIAHDFNNLLASIMGFTELALDDLPAQSRARACLDRVLGASLRAREMVRQILSFSRRGEHKLRHLRADSVVGEALKLMEASLAKNIEIRAVLASHSFILADPSQVHQIVMNLCTNAAQAMRECGGRLEVRTGRGLLPPEIAARRRLSPGEYVRLDVEDQGPGIAPELLGRIFDPFFTTKGPGEGTGLGLAVVHGIVTSLGGDVWAESEPGGGARFSVLLPAQLPPPEAPAEKSPEDLRGSERILVVDDEPDLLDFCREALAPLGYQVTTTSDPQAALEALRQAPQDCDLLVTDLNMPRISGLALAEELRPLAPRLPIVLITGFSRTIPPDRLESLGAVRILPKPFSTSELALAVRQAFAGPTGGSNAPSHSSG